MTVEELGERSLEVVGYRKVGVGFGFTKFRSYFFIIYGACFGWIWFWKVGYGGRNLFI